LGHPGLKPGAATQVWARLKSAPRGGLPRVDCAGPAFGGMRSIVVVALATNVTRDGIEVGWPKRLGPVTGLPSETTRRTAIVVQLVGGRALEMPHELSERHAGGEPNDDVHVIGGAPRGKHHAAELAGLSAHDREKAVVEQGRQHRAPS
jgi:hypothetical protein